MKNKSDILAQIGGKSGYKVPEGYFEQFAERMIEQLPEREIPKPEVVTTWQRLRPYLYLAAMFVGIWLMVQAFVAPAFEAQQELLAANEHEQDLEEYIYYSNNEYTFFEAFYADGE